MKREQIKWWEQKTFGYLMSPAVLLAARLSSSYLRLLLGNILIRWHSWVLLTMRSLPKDLRSLQEATPLPCTSTEPWLVDIMINPLGYKFNSQCAPQHLCTGGRGVWVTPDVGQHDRCWIRSNIGQLYFHLRNIYGNTRIRLVLEVHCVLSEKERCWYCSLQNSWPSSPDKRWPRGWERTQPILPLLFSYILFLGLFDIKIRLSLVKPTSQHFWSIYKKNHNNQFLHLYFQYESCLKYMHIMPSYPQSTLF